MDERFSFAAGILIVATACDEAGTLDTAAAASDGGGRGGGDRMVSDGGVAEDALLVPEGLIVTVLPGGNGVLTLFALTLRKGASGTGLYAALRNDDANTRACDPSLSVELYDKDRQPMGTWIGALNTKDYYQVVEAGTVASCVGPGGVTMAALTDLPSDLVIDNVGYVVYRCSYFALDVVPIDGLSIRGVVRLADPDGTAFIGTLVNRFDAAVSSPAVAVFPVNPVGRPLGVARSSGTAEIPTGGTWDFQTSAVDVPATEFVAYATAAVGP